MGEVKSSAGALREQKPPWHKARSQSLLAEGVTGLSLSLSAGTAAHEKHPLPFFMFSLVVL